MCARSASCTCSSLCSTPAGRSSVSELAKRRNTKAWQLHRQWEDQEGLRHWGKGGSLPGSPLGPCVLSPALPCRGALPHGNDSCLPAMPVCTKHPIATLLAPVAYRGSQSLVPGLIRTCLPILARESKFHLKVKPK
jgi:hypothetical protein